MFVRGEPEFGNIWKNQKCTKKLLYPSHKGYYRNRFSILSISFIVPLIEALQGRGEITTARRYGPSFADWLPTGSRIVPKIVRNLSKK